MCVLLFLILINPGIGIEAGFSGGPTLSLTMTMELNERISLNGSIGGFPGIILVSRAGIRVQLTRTELSSYVQTGVGYFHYYRGTAKGKGIKEAHFDLGLLWPNTGKWKLNFDLGLLYAPYSINHWLQEEYPEVPLFIYPVVHTGLVYFIRS